MFHVMLFHKSSHTMAQYILKKMFQSAHEILICIIALAEQSKAKFEEDAEAYQVSESAPFMLYNQQLISRLLLSSTPMRTRSRVDRSERCFSSFSLSGLMANLTNTDAPQVLRGESLFNSFYGSKCCNNIRHGGRPFYSITARMRCH